MPFRNAQLEAFVAGDAFVARAIELLAAGESMTDDVARAVLKLTWRPFEWRERFLHAVHTCDFVVERNSEWHLAPDARRELLERLSAQEDASEQVHTLLLSIAEADPDSPKLGETPRYLIAGPGRAYHGAFLKKPWALQSYSEVADAPLTGQQWLASRLVEEQVSLGVLPPNALEVTFVRAMVLYREGRTSEAEPLLRRLAARTDHRREVAIAAHLVGRLDVKGHRHRVRGIKALERSYKMLSDLGDAAGIAQVANTLGQAVGQDQDRVAEAERLLRESLSISESLGDAGGGALAMHTLGQLLSREPTRRREAEGVLRQALDILGPEAELLHTLGQLVGRDATRREEAERLLRESLAAEARRNDEFGIAQVQHTLGQLLARDPDRAGDARNLLERSLEFGERRNNRNHQAQVLASMARLHGTEAAEAVELYERSLELNKQIGNRRGQAIVRAALAELGGEQESQP